MLSFDFSFYNSLLECFNMSNHAIKCIKELVNLSKEVLKKGIYKWSKKLYKGFKEILNEKIIFERKILNINKKDSIYKIEKKININNRANIINNLLIINDKKLFKKGGI